MDNDNDFTFCKVDLPPDQERLDGQAVPNIGGLSIMDESSNGSHTNQTGNSFWKNNSFGKAPVKEETVGSLSFTVVNAPPSKQTTSTGVKDAVMGLEEQTPSTKSPKVRAKVPYEKGYSQMDWLKLTRTHPDLAGLKGESNNRLISMAEVKLHQREGSIWTVLKGRVYNITPYMKFHPGGVDMLMKGAGKDCTSLFNKYHAWVNAEFMLEKCLIGTLDDSR